MQTYNGLSGGTYQFMAQVQGGPPGQAAVAQVCLQHSHCVSTLNLYFPFSLSNPHHHIAERELNPGSNLMGMSICPGHRCC